MSKKVETSIHTANGGNHSQARHREHRNMLLTHPYTNGRLYHIVLTGSEDRSVYRKAVNALCKLLRAKGMPCRYKAAYERDKRKRFHKHVFLLVEAKDVNPDSIIHHYEGHWFTKMLRKLGLGYEIVQPSDPMHRVAGKQMNYAYVPKKAGKVLDDCLLWISYLTKVRSKNGVEGQIYTGSTNREPKKTESIERNHEAITEKEANRSPENRPPNEVMDFPVHSLEHEANSTTSASSYEAKASDECHGASRVETSYAALNRESPLPLIDRPVREREIGQIGWSTANRSKIPRFCPVQAPEMACKRLGNLGILNLPYQTSTRSQA